MVCGLDIEWGWAVEMCDINKDFDKHCLLNQKRLIQGFCINFLIYITDGITMHCSDSDWTINISHLIFIGTINW